jgi:hypothetical protein
MQSYPDEEIINFLYESLAQNKIKYFILGIIRKDGGYNTYHSVNDEISFLEKIGLIDEVKSDLRKYRDREEEKMNDNEYEGVL